MAKHKRIAIVFIVLGVITVVAGFMLALSSGLKPYGNYVEIYTFWYGFVISGSVFVIIGIYMIGLINSVMDKFADLKDEIHHLRQQIKDS